MRTRRLGIRRFLPAALALAAGVALAALPAAEAAQPPLPAAVVKTSKAGSFRFAFALSVTGGGQLLPNGKPLALTGRGAVDTRRSSGHVTVNLGALASALGGATGGAKVPSTVDVIVLDNVLYVRFPALAQQVAPGKEWLKLDPGKLPKSATGGINLSQLGQVNPKQALSALQAAVKTEELGSESVRGVSATRYRATIDVARAVAALPKAKRAEALKAVKQLGLTSIPVDAWVDGSGYLRRIAAALTLEAQRAPVTMKISMDLFDFGKPVRIAAPPAAKVADATQLLTQLLGGLAGSGKTGSP